MLSAEGAKGWVLEPKLGEYNLCPKPIFIIFSARSQSRGQKHNTTIHQKNILGGSHTLREQRAGSEAPCQTLRLERRPCPELSCLYKFFLGIQQSINKYF